MNRIFAFVLLALAGCSTAGLIEPQGPLASQVGQYVELRGSYYIGKLSNGINTRDGSVYLFEPTRPSQRLTPGTLIVAKGKLEFNQGAPGRQCDSYDCAIPGIPPHYFITGASIVVAP